MKPFCVKYCMCVKVKWLESVCKCMFADCAVNFARCIRGNNLQCHRPTHTTSVMTHIFSDIQRTQCVLDQWIESVTDSKCYLFVFGFKCFVPTAKMNYLDLKDLHFYDYAKALLWSWGSGEWSELITFTNTFYNH